MAIKIKKKYFKFYIFIFKDILKYLYLKLQYNFPTVLTSDETLRLILDNPQMSISRFGDGEFNLIIGKSVSFQDYNKELSKKLCEILKNSNNETCFIFIPRSLNSLKSFSTNAKLIHLHLISIQYPKYQKYLSLNFTYGDALFTRFYIDNVHKKLENYIDLLKKIWHGKDLLIVEGKFSKLGIGNDLFNNANSIVRILTNNTNAFNKYQSILDSVIINSEKKLILAALGPTASVLAYDLSNLGIRCLDIGHIDIEYSWYLKNSKSKEVIRGKHVNELGYSGNDETESFNNTLNIIAEIY